MHNGMDIYQYMLSQSKQNTLSLFSKRHSKWKFALQSGGSLAVLAHFSSACRLLQYNIFVLEIEA